MLDLTKQQELKELIIKQMENNKNLQLTYAKLFRLCIKHLRGNTPGRLQPLVTVHADKKQKAELVKVLEDLVKRLESENAQEQTEQAQACAG